MRQSLGLRLMRAHPSAPWAGPHTAPQRGDENLPAREHETGILWVYYGPIPATPRALSAEPWGWCPDLDDDATIGVLLASARRAWDAPRLACHWFEGNDGPYAEPGWIVDLGDGENVVAGATDYAEALILAIEGAPNQERTVPGPAIRADDVADIEARLEAITPGAWTHDPTKCWVPGKAGAKPVLTAQEAVFGDIGAICLTGTVDDLRSMADAEFIAHAPADIRRLLALVRR